MGWPSRGELFDWFCQLRGEDAGIMAFHTSDDVLHDAIQYHLGW